MEKKRYRVALLADGSTYGTVDLTPAQAKLIEKITNPGNWDNVTKEPYCGSFWIDVDNPMPIN